MTVCRSLALAALLALHPLPGLAQAAADSLPKAAEDTGAARALASRFLDQVRADQIVLSSLLGPGRIGVVSMLVRNHMTEDAAGEVYDRFLAPEFKARLPELRERMTDILVADFTADELQSIVDNRQDAARQSAAAKAGQLQDQFRAAGQQWGQKIGADMFRAHADEIKALGFQPPGTGN